MAGSQNALPTLILLLGGIVILSIFMRSGLKRLGIPSAVGFLLAGLVIRLADSRWQLLPDDTAGIFEFLATIGIILLLFRVGLESNLAGLRRQLKPAGIIWVGNILLSGGFGFVLPYYALGLALIPSLFVAVALTATSVAISVAVWQESGNIRSRIGELLVDAAEMDDISGIVFMVLLLAVAPLLRGNVEASPAPVLLEALGWTLLKFAGFTAFCIVFSRYAERHITGFLRRITATPGQTLVVSGFGLAMAALGGLLGLSVAIGAFFGGLVFSRDPEAVKLDTPFTMLFEFFTPFFFINIGLSIDPDTLLMALGLGGVLLVPAVLGKLVGSSVPALATTGWRASLLLGVSMIPRAEIAMVIMHGGLALGDWAVPPHVFSAMVFVSAVTTVASPVILGWLLPRWLPEQG